MRNPFCVIHNHPRRFWVWLVGVGEILDGLVTVLSLGFVVGQFSWIFMAWDIRNATKGVTNGNQRDS